MHENAVIEATCKYLEEDGFTITQRLTTSQQGIDIKANNTSTGVEVFVEAKGNTSSKEGSKRYGKENSSTQVFNRVSTGVFKCLQLRVEYPDRLKYRVILAVPDVRLFRGFLEPNLLAVIETAGIEILFIQV